MPPLTHLSLSRRCCLQWQGTIFVRDGAVNGRGLIIANADLWLGRNQGLSRALIEKHLLALPGMRKVLWVPHGLAHDPLHRATITGRYVGWGTGGHSDEFVRFADENTVLLPTYVAHGTPPERQDAVQMLYQSVFPGRTVKFIDAMNANWVGGGAHCATLTEPG